MRIRKEKEVTSDEQKMKEENKQDITRVAKTREMLKRKII